MTRTNRKPREKNLIHEIFPAEKRLAKIDELEMALDRRRADLPLTEYVRAKKALTVKRLIEFRRIERANDWNPWEPLDDPEPEAGPVMDQTDPPDPEPVTPRKRRYLHYAIFWVDLWLLSMLICWLAPYLKK